MKCLECQLVNTPDSKFCKRCGTQLSPPEEISVSVTKTLKTPLRRLECGALFAGRYEVLEELGKGGMGEVYRVRDHKLDEEMALKLLRPEIASDQSSLERFQNELKLARRITHKNVCRMHDFHEQEDTPYITMEYVRGVDLKSLIKKQGVLEKQKALVIAKQVCEGLVEAHKLGVVHRDLKPQNIMIDENDNAKIMDFGIARSLEAGGMTQTGMIIGTPDYISPEQAEGREADHRSDIYSLGVILYEMVTGDVPFKGDTALSVALKHKSQLPLDPKKLNPEVSDDLARLILICMEKDRERRYQTAAALLDDLRNVEEGFPLGTKIRPRRVTFISALIRKKLFIPAIAVALALVAIAVWRLLPPKGAPPPEQSGRPSIAIMYFKNYTGDQNLDYLSETLPALMTIDLRESKYLYVLPNDRLIQIMNRFEVQEKGNYSRDVLEKVADWGVIEHIIQGGYFKEGDDLRIHIQIQKAGSWEIIGSETESGQLDLHTKMVDELTLKIKPYFNLSAQEIAADIDLDIGRIRGSPEAFVHYQAGMKFWASGKNTEAVEAFRKALDIDPDFAMAHIFLARILGGWWLQLPEAQEHWKKASALAERLTERERYFVEAALSRGQDAIEPLKKILELYPEDWLAKYELGRRYFGLEEWEKVRELLLENKRNKVDFPLNYRLLARVYEYMGLYDEAVKICKYYLEKFSDSATVREILAHAYLCKRQLDIALEEVNHSLALKQAAAGDYVKGNILMCSEDWANAEKEFQALIDQDTHYSAMIGIEGLAHMLRTQGRLKESIERYDEGQRRARAWPYSSFPFYFPHHLAYLYFQQGNLKEALKIADEVLKENSYPSAQVRCQLLRGHIYLHQGSIEEALKIAEGMKAILADELNEQPKLMRYHYLLMGLIEFTKNNYEDAEKYQIQALSLLPFPGYWAQRYDDHAVFYDALATTYVESGELDKAQEQYEKITSLNEGRLSFGIIYAKSFYRLGQIFEQKGWKGKAIEHYEKFLDLWKDADPGLPEVDDARKRLAGLKAN